MSPNEHTALGDALAGVAASLVSLWAFYPVDVLKTRVQAAGRAVTNETTTRALWKFPHGSEWVSGLPWKSLYTACSSFCYFYLYSWIVSTWKKQHKNRHRDTTTPPSVATRLLLAAVAAMINTCLTLPLDVISARLQTQRCSNEGTAGRRGKEDRSSRNGDHPTSGTIDNHDDDDDAPETDSKTESTRKSLCTGDAKTLVQRWREIQHLWKGLGPSLLLCSNPAIHYTVFDSLKQHMMNQNNSATSSSLSTWQAFVLGLVAKFVATIATYPLIRAKVMLMVTSGGAWSSSLSSEQQPHGHQTVNMVSILYQEYKRHGVLGLYTGCNLQLLHTLFKSALLMAVRERISQTTQALVNGSTVTTTRSSAR